MAILCPGCKEPLTNRAKQPDGSLKCVHCGKKLVVKKKPKKSAEAVVEVADDDLEVVEDDDYQLQAEPITASPMLQSIDTQVPGARSQLANATPARQFAPKPSAAENQAQLQAYIPIIAAVVGGGLVFLAITVGALVLVFTLRTQPQPNPIAQANTPPTPPPAPQPNNSTQDNSANEAADSHQATADSTSRIQNALQSNTDPSPSFSESANDAESSRTKSPTVVKPPPVIAPPPVKTKPRPRPGSRAALLDDLKRSTVLIKTRTTAGTQTGTGFVMHRDGRRGVIVTNAHVIRARKGRLQRPPYEVVFHSGTREEVEVEANLLGADDARDLAVLAVDHDTIPFAINAEEDVDLYETLPVLVLGFPFGELLETGGRNPAITVTKASVTSIRKDDRDNVAVIQLDGGINPGNSGGPIVSEDGQLLGVAVAKVIGADIGFAIPKHHLTDVLAGRIISANIREIKRESDYSIYRFNIDSVDPLNKLKKLEVLTFAKSNQVRTKPETDGTWKAAAEKYQATEVPLDANGRTNVSIKVTKLGKDAMAQLRWERRTGGVFHSPPLTMRASAVAPDAKLAMRDERSFDDSTKPELKALPNANSRDETLKLPTECFEVDVAAGGKYLIFNLRYMKKLVVVDVAKREIVNIMNVNGQGYVAAGLEKLVFVTPTVIQRWDLKTFTRDLAKPWHLKFRPVLTAMGHASHGPVLIGGGSRLSREPNFVLLDADTLENIPLPEKLGPQRFEINESSRVRAAANGSLFGTWRTSTSPNGFMIMNLQGEEPMCYSHHSTFGFITPGADGSRVYTGKGIYNGRGQRIDTKVKNQAQTIPIPAATGRYFLRISTVRNRGERGQVQATLNIDGYDGAIAELEPFVLPETDSFSYMRFGNKEIGLDQRVQFFPDLNTLVILPATNDRVLFRKVDVDGALASSGVDYLFVTSSPPSRVKVGSKFSYQIQAKSKQGDLSFKLSSGPSGMALDAGGFVEWSPKAKDIGRHDVLIAVSDASGQDVFHTFRLDVLNK